MASLFLKKRVHFEKISGGGGVSLAKDVQEKSNRREEFRGVY